MIGHRFSRLEEEPPPLPSAEIIREDIKKLKEEFFEHKLSEYVDIYNGTHAMIKYVYHFDRYIKPEIRSRSRKWCEFQLH
jgi:hypothetical protein